VIQVFLHPIIPLSVNAKPPIPSIVCDDGARVENKAVVNPRRRMVRSVESKEQIARRAVSWMSDSHALICAGKRQILEAFINRICLLEFSRRAELDAPQKRHSATVVSRDHDGERWGVRIALSWLWEKVDIWYHRLWGKVDV
jgi:hypothetical protein